MIPDWQLPPGVDRGLWDYLHAADMVSGYESQMEQSPLAKADVAFCEKAFPTPGKLLDLGCGTGRLCRHFAAKGYECVGVDLSDEMLAVAKDEVCRLGGEASYRISLVTANFVERLDLPDASFDYAACLFSTLGMVRGAENRAKVLANAFRLLKPGGKFVLHVHNRYFRGLGWRRILFGNGDVTMPQAYGGAPLTLHHFSKREAVRLLEGAGFAVREVRGVGLDGGPGGYGYLLLGERPV
ncbi:MAG TPA: class I SAM-dependent methyltransferase [Gemmataceae bacterium]|nr:class I SAM-dependent methyltransferase [Gemmataceae bacterium]